MGKMRVGGVMVDNFSTVFFISFLFFLMSAEVARRMEEEEGRGGEFRCREKG